jgi:hypothetical protein
MSRAPLAAALLVALALPAAAQNPADPFSQQSANMSGQPAKKSIRFAGDALTRYEWTRDSPDATPENDLDGDGNVNRWRLQARPRLEVTLGPLDGAVGGDFNYSEDENDALVNGEPPALIRDNYKSQDARFDLYYGRLTIGPVSAQGGRFFMPLPLTEMIWDADLRPLGGAATVSIGAGGMGTGQMRFSATGLYTKGSHVYEDESILWGGGAEIRLGAGPESSLSLGGAYLVFDDLDGLDPAIRRQNTRVGDVFDRQFHVVDLVGRLGTRGALPMSLVVDYCWNTERDDNNRGLWISATLGNTEISRASLGYTYAKVDRDATVAAFNTDDFIWGTGWEGHRAELTSATAKRTTAHAIAQWQRFKDSPDPVQAERWVTRYRVEMRTSF